LCGNAQALEHFYRLQPPVSFWLQTCEYEFGPPSGPYAMVGVTATHIAATHNYHVDFLKRLTSLRITSNVNSVTHCNTTPLHMACWTESLEATKFLISRGANVNARRSNGWLLLDCAFDGSHFEVAQALLKSGSEKPFTSPTWRIGSQRLACGRNRTERH
jgi:hypothetical protein